MQWNELKSHLRHIKTKDQQRIREAFELGKKKHGGQKRKSGEPYFMHPIAVTHILADMNADADTLIAALLHDTVEDTDLTLAEINKQFNGDVASLIDGVTKLEPEDVADSPTLDDQIETIRKMFTLMEEDIRVMIIKLVDRLHNMQTIEHLKEQRQVALARETLDVYVKIADRLSLQDMRNELEGLCIAILEPQTHKKLLQIQEKNERKGEGAIQKLVESIEEKEPDIASSIDILFERKSWGRLRDQLHAGNNAATGVSAITAVFVCDNVQDCYEVLGVLHRFWSREALSFQDYINAPMINGYRGLHTTIILKDGLRIRCKIRTFEMHEYARKGITTLCFDSEATGVLEYLLPWTERIAPISTDSKERSDQFWENLKNDILGESIVMYGSDSQQVLLPQDSTALDGALYLYGSKALRVKEILINGDPVPFYEKLPNASTLTATFTKKTQVKIDWLEYIHTGIAGALIREGIAKTPESQRVEKGRQLMETAMLEIKHIGLAELNTKSFQEKLKEALGIETVRDLLLQVGEGKIQAPFAISAIFGINKSGSTKRKWNLLVQYPISLTEQILSILRKILPSKLHFSKKGETSSIQAQYLLTDAQAEHLRTELAPLITEDNFELQPLRKKNLLLWSIGILLALWGLDPVVAHRILATQVSSIDLTVIRSFTFFGFATLFYIVHSSLTQTKLKPINPLRPTLVLSGVALFATALFTYLALTIFSPTSYIVFIISMIVLNGVLHDLVRHRVSLLGVVGFLLLVGAGILSLTSLQSHLGVMYGILSALSFIAYSTLSETYQHDVEHIQARYPAFLFWLSLIILPMGMAIMPLAQLETLPVYWILTSMLYVLVFSMLPYAIFFECMRRMKMEKLMRLLPLVCIWTLAGDLLLNHSLETIHATPLLLAGAVVVVLRNFLQEEN